MRKTSRSEGTVCFSHCPVGMIASKRLQSGDSPFGGGKPGQELSKKSEAMH